MYTVPDSVGRHAEADIASQFLDRWSPRAFESSPLPEGCVEQLMEAARWAPSCFNDQPWAFVVAESEADRSRFIDLLSAGNQSWAKRAPLLLFVLAAKRFRHNDKPNRWGGFDAGAAWMSLALQAHAMGLSAHAMGGFDRERAHAELDIPIDDFDIMAAVALGRRGDPSMLRETQRERETPSDRRPQATFVHRGRFAAAH